MTVAARAARAAGRRLSTASNYDELIECIRTRIDELQISQALLEEIAGLTTGHLGKLLGGGRVKNFGALTLFLILEALAVKIVFEEDSDLLRKMERRYERRAEWARRSTGIIRRNISPQLKLAAVSEYMSEIGRIGGRGRSKCVAASSARAAAIARWSKVRNGGSNGKSR